jgi:2-haloacid dehalogenase
VGILFALLAFLSDRPLAILSNGTVKMLQAVVENAGLKGVFSNIISTDEAKTYKPNPAAYGLAVRALVVDKRDIDFISWNFCDAARGKVFGFGTYWVNRRAPLRISWASRLTPRYDL